MLPYTSIDAVFSLNQVNEALDKVKRGGSKWKTIIKVHESRSTYGYKCGIRKNVIWSVDDRDQYQDMWCLKPFIYRKFNT